MSVLPQVRALLSLDIYPSEPFMHDILGTSTGSPFSRVGLSKLLMVVSGFCPAGSDELVREKSY